MAAKGTVKAGPITLAFGLILGGLLILLYNFHVITRPEVLWKLWPLLLIGLGVEYFLKRAFNREEEVQIHAASVILIIIIILAGGALYAATFAGRNLDKIISGIPWHEMDLTHQRTWTTNAIDIKPGQKLSIEKTLKSTTPPGRLNLHGSNRN